MPTYAQMKSYLTSGMYQVAPPPALPEPVEVAPRPLEEQVAPPAAKRELSKPSTFKVLIADFPQTSR